MGPIGVQEMLVILLLVAAALSGFIFWLWILVDCATKESDAGSTKVVWIIIIIFTHIIGAVVYWLVRRPKRYTELGR